MSNLTLPFAASGSSSTLTGSDGAAFATPLTDGGGVAIQVESFGVDRYEDAAIGIYAESDGVAIQAIVTDSGTAPGYPTAVYGSAAKRGVGVFGTQGDASIESDRPA